MKEAFEPCCSCKKYDIGYEKGRSDAINEFAKELHKYIGLDTNLNHHNVDFLAEQVKEQKNDKL